MCSHMHLLRVHGCEYGGVPTVLSEPDTYILGATGKDRDASIHGRRRR
jgi:hypothetical protein